MVTLENKIDIILRYIATDDETLKAQLREEASNALLTDTTPAHISPDIDDVIEDLLKEIGIPCHLKGHEHLCCAIKLCYSDKKYIEQITKELYPTVSVRCDTTSTRVERAIRHAIECVWNTRDIDNATVIFGNTLAINKGKPTNGEFLSACTKEVKRRMKNC